MRYCRCGEVKEKQIDTVEFVIFDFKIVVHRTPHFLCSRCGIRSYSSDTKITELVKLAYKHQIKELELDYFSDIVKITEQ